jgi:uncharacterized phosphosugar-binding protein
MTDNFFDRLETELSGLARESAHRGRSARAGERVATAVRRGMVLGVLAAVLAVALVSEFPGTAGGRVLTVAAAIHQSL